MPQAELGTAKIVGPEEFHRRIDLLQKRFKECDLGVPGCGLVGGELFGELFTCAGSNASSQMGLIASAYDRTLEAPGMQRMISTGLEGIYTIQDHHYSLFLDEILAYEQVSMPVSRSAAAELVEQKNLLDIRVDEGVRRYSPLNLSMYYDSAFEQYVIIGTQNFSEDKAAASGMFIEGSRMDRDTAASFSNILKNLTNEALIAKLAGQELNTAEILQQYRPDLFENVPDTSQFIVKAIENLNSLARRYTKLVLENTDASSTMAMLGQVSVYEKIAQTLDMLPNMDEVARGDYSRFYSVNINGTPIYFARHEVMGMEASLSRTADIVNQVHNIYSAGGFIIEKATNRELITHETFYQGLTYKLLQVVEKSIEQPLLGSVEPNDLDHYIAVAQNSVRHLLRNLVFPLSYVTLDKFAKNSDWNASGKVREGAYNKLLIVGKMLDAFSDIQEGEMSINSVLELIGIIHKDVGKGTLNAKIEVDSMPTPLVLSMLEIVFESSVVFGDTRSHYLEYLQDLQREFATVGSSEGGTKSYNLLLAEELRGQIVIVNELLDSVLNPDNFLINISLEELPGGIARFIIEDNGMGMDRSVLEDVGAKINSHKLKRTVEANTGQGKPLLVRSVGAMPESERVRAAGLPLVAIGTRGETVLTAEANASGGEAEELPYLVDIRDLSEVQERYLTRLRYNSGTSFIMHYALD